MTAQAEEITVMQVRVNGVAQVLPEGGTLQDVVAVHAPTPRGIAVAHNGEVVPRAGWGSAVVRAGDEVEIVTAVQGG